MTKTIIATVLLLLSTSLVYADSNADLQVITVQLESQVNAWKKDVEKFEQRQREKSAQIQELKQAPEKVQQLTEKSQKALLDAMKTAAKGLPTAFNGTDLAKAKLGIKSTEKVLKAKSALGELGVAQSELIDGTIDNKIAVLSQHVTDLKNKIAIYNAFISGVQTNINQVNQTITAQRTQAWATFLGKIAAAQSEAQQRVDARHAAEKAAAEKAAAEKAAADAKKSGSGEGREGRGARQDPTGQGGNQTPGNKDPGQKKEPAAKEPPARDPGNGVGVHQG